MTCLHTLFMEEAFTNWGGMVSVVSLICIQNTSYDGVDDMLIDLYKINDNTVIYLIQVKDQPKSNNVDLIEEEDYNSSDLYQIN